MGDGVPIPREVSQKVYSSKFEDYCDEAPVQLYFYTALIMKDLLASAGQAMDAEACSSSATPGTTAGATGQKSTFDGLRKRPPSASSIAADATSKLTETLRGLTQSMVPHHQVHASAKAKLLLTTRSGRQKPPRWMSTRSSR